MKLKTRLIILLFLLQGVVSSQESPEVVLQKGHTDAVFAASQIGETQLMASVSKDGSINIWDLKSRAILRTLYMKNAKDEVVPILSGAFAPDGSWFVGTSRTGEIRRLSLPDGKTLAEFAAPKRPGVGGNSVPESPLLATNGRAIFFVPYERVSSDGIFKFSLDGKELGKIDTNAGEIRGKWAVGDDTLVVGDSYRLQCYSTETLQPLSQTEIDPQEGGIARMSFNSSGSKLAVSTLRGLKVFDATTLEILAELPCDDGNENSTRFAPIWSGEKLYAFAYANEAKEQKLYQANFSSSKLEKSQAQGGARFGTPLSDGKLCIGGPGLSCFVVDPGSGEKLGLEGDKGGFTAFATSPTGDLLTGGRQGDVKHWSGETGQLLRTFDGLKMVTSLGVSPDGQHLVGGDVLGKTVCWELATGKPLGVVEGRYRPTSHSEVAVTTVTFLDNDRFFRQAQHEPVGLHSLSGELLDSWKLDGETIAFDSARRRLAAGSVQEVSLQDKRKAVLDQRFESAATALHYDGEKLLVGTESGALFRWDYNDPEAKPELVVELSGGVIVKSISSTPSSWILLAEGKSQGELVELSKTGKVQRKVSFEGRGLRNLTLTASRRVLATGPNYTLQFFDQTSGKKLGSLVGVRDNQGWVALETDGHFDGNSDGLQTVSFELGGEVYQVDQFLQQYLLPGSLARLLGEPEKANLPRTGPELTKSTLKKPPKVSIVEPQSGAVVEGESVLLKLEATDGGAGIGKLTLSHNGHRLPDSQIRSLGGGKFEAEVSAVKGLNEFSATAFEASNSVESRTDRCRISAPNVKERPPRLHLLAIGIDEYKSGLALNLAAVDSESMSKQFSSHLYAPGERIHLTNGEATLTGIQKAAAQIAQEAEPQDAFVFYLAGHGTVVGDTYYFLPYDVEIESDEALTNSSISSEELAGTLRDIPATKQLIILDSCKSGAAVGVVGRYYAARSGLEEIRSQQLLAEASGTFLIAATKADEYAYEIPELGHGVLTFAVLEALGKTSSDQPGASRVSVNDLLRLVSSRVPALSQKYQGVRQQVLQYSSGQDFLLQSDRP